MTRLGPDFFLVGAPKCGTTALHDYLATHPEVFMAPKEQHFFGSDLDEIWLRPGHSRRPTDEEYFGFFAPSTNATRRGDSSVWCLYSQTAAQEIRDYCPSARIIIMLRDPLDMLPSLHSQLFHDGVEDIPTFAAALRAEADRRAGRRIPPSNGSVPWRLFYRDIGRFHSRVARYLDVFGPEQVHIILFDDFVQQPAATYAGVLRFLDVDTGHLPGFRVINANKRVRSRRVQQFAFTLWDPSSRVRRVGTRMIPVHPVRSALLHRGIPLIRRLNTAHPQRAQLPEDVRSGLAADLAPDNALLGELIGRDLKSWHTRDGAYSLT